ncbi:MAG: molybdopterin-dependent oxidoreductase [Chloroflexi bacterium]|nr:molybdopterin-dependent oxidoreductase [Chloroflexota bacterium]
MKELLELPKFPTAHMPAFDRVAWRLTVDGLVSNPLSLTHDDVLALPRIDQVSSFSCVEGWRVSDNRWEGVAVSTLLERAGLWPEARYVIFHAGAFFVSLSVTTAMKPTTLLAHSLNGGLLPPEHGFPLRLVAPGKQCYYGVKWVQRLEVVRRARQSGKTIALGRVRGTRAQVTA